MGDGQKPSIVDRFGALSTMRLNRRSFVRFSAAAAGMAVSVPLLSACGDDDDEPAAATNTVGTSAEPTATTAEESASPTAADESTATVEASPDGEASPTTGTGSGGMLDGGDRNMGRDFEVPENPGGTMIEASILDLRSLNPILFNDNPSYSVGYMIYQTLAEANPETLEPVGNLAVGWETNDDATVWTMFLREGVTWSDGEAFDAEDVKFSYDMYADPTSGSNQTSTLNSKLDSVEIIDDMTVQFNLKLPVVDFLLDIGGVYFLMLAEHIWGDVAPADVQQHPGSTGDDPTMVVGTGPFLFDEWVTGDHVRLVKNPNYWDGDVYLDEFVYKIVPDTAAALSQLRTGEVDMFLQVPGSEAENLASDDITITAFSTLSFNFYGTQLDETKSTKFLDARVRKALLHGIDRQAMVDEINFGFSQVAIGTIPVLSWAYAPDLIDPALHYEYDPERSAELLDEAGWLVGSDGIREKDGEKMSFEMYGNGSSETTVQFLVAIQEFWRAIGVEMIPSPEPFQNLVARITETFDFEAFTVSFGWGPIPDQSSMWKCSSYGVGFNIVKYCNPEVDEVLDAALSELDRDRRIELYAQFQNLLLDDLPMAVTDFPQAIAGVSSRVHNFFPSAQNSRFNPEAWWVDQ